MNTKKEHWRQLVGKEFLIGEELGGKDVTLTIKELKLEMLQNVKGKEEKPVLYFEKTEKKLVLNVTNMRDISKVLGTPYYADWAGRQITLTPLEGRFFGEDQTVIRIKKDYSQIKPISHDS